MNRHRAFLYLSVVLFLLLLASTKPSEVSSTPNVATLPSNANVNALEIPQAEWYLPSQSDLPPGFELQPDKSQAVLGGMGILRQYIRKNPEVAPDDQTVLEIGITIATDATRADSIFTNTVNGWVDQGYTFDAYDGLGERAVTGRKLLDLDEGEVRQSEIVTVYFRIGVIAGAVAWLDYADLPNMDYAFGVARLIEAKVWERPDPFVVPTTPPVVPTTSEPSPYLVDLSGQGKGRSEVFTANGPIEFCWEVSKAPSRIQVGPFAQFSIYADGGRIVSYIGAGDERSPAGCKTNRLTPGRYYIDIFALSDTNWHVTVADKASQTNPSTTPVQAPTVTRTPVPTVTPPSIPAPPPSSGCCARCTKGKPCGNSCIAANLTCHQPPGCACAASGSVGLEPPALVSEPDQGIRDIESLSAASSGGGRCTVPISAWVSVFVQQE